MKNKLVRAYTGVVVILMVLLLAGCESTLPLFEPEFVCDLSKEIVWCESENGKQSCECRLV